MPLPPRRRSQSIRDRAAGLLRNHRAATLTLAATVDRLGAGGYSDNLMRVVADVSVGRLPTTDGSHAARLLMHRVGGRDQCTLAMEADWRSFEAPMPEVFWALCRHLPGQVVDVGANTGFYALIALLADPHREVTAFEPVPTIRRLLTENIAMVKRPARAHIRAEAVGSQTGTATLFVPPHLPDGYIETSASLSPAFKGGEGERLEVPVTTLDIWWTNASSPTVTIMKIDVESREYDVLLGAEALVASEEPILFYELLPSGDAARIGTWAKERDLIDIRLRPNQAVIDTAPKFDPDAWNHMLVPRPRMTTVEATLRECRLAITSA